ncbi:MAG TPA: hypothetical protein VH371_06675 [Candidatus Limnocylindrales bacterium]
MRVVAAKFLGTSQASAARDLLRRELDRTDVEVAPLAHPGEAVHGEALLAGRFPDRIAPSAVRLVIRAGGEIVADIDERLTGIGPRVHESGKSLEFKVAGWSSGSSSGS